MTLYGMRKRDGRAMRAVITKEIACQILRAHNAGEHPRELAACNGISESAVYSIIAGRTWRDETLETRRELIRLGKAKQGG